MSGTTLKNHRPVLTSPAGKTIRIRFARTLDENFHQRTDSPLRPGLGLAGQKTKKILIPFLFDFFRDFVRLILRGAGSLPRRVTKDKTVIELHLFQKFVSGLVIFLRFPRISDNHIRGQPQSRGAFPNLLDDSAILVGRISPPHHLEHPVGSRLHRKMKMLTQFLQTPIASNQIRLHSPRMRRGESQTLQSLDVFKRFQKLYKRRLSRDRGNFTSPIHVHDLSKQSDFLHPLGNERFYLLDDFKNRARSFLPACGRNNAKRAVHVAPLHHRDKRRHLLGSQGVVTNRSLRPLLFPDISQEAGLPLPPCHPGLIHKVRDTVKLLCPDHQVQPLHLFFQRLPFALGHAP